MKKTALRYEIRIEGHLAPQRLRHFEMVTVRQEADGQSVILARCRDQSALYGLLFWLQGLGVTLLHVQRDEEDSDTWDCM
jgi:hypothetical protein